MFFLSLPILLETERIIGIWLKTVPEYTVIFCQLILINSLIQCFDASLGIIFQATGKVKENQIFSGGLYLLVLPISYFLLKLSNNPPQIVFVVQIIITVIVSFVVKIILINKIINISLKEYWQKLIFPVSKVSVIAIIVPLLIRYSLPETVWRLLWVALFSFLSIGITIYCTGVNKIDRERIKKYFVLNVQRYIKHEK
jgi:hypothetical protein